MSQRSDLIIVAVNITSYWWKFCALGPTRQLGRTVRFRFSLCPPNAWVVSFMDATKNFNVTTTAFRCNHRIVKDDEASLCLIVLSYPKSFSFPCLSLSLTLYPTRQSCPFSRRLRRRSIREALWSRPRGWFPLQKEPQNTPPMATATSPAFGILNAHPPPPLPPSQAPPQRSFLESLTPLCLLFSPFSLCPSHSCSLSRRSFSCSLPPFLWDQ